MKTPLISIPISDDTVSTMAKHWISALCVADSISKRNEYLYGLK